MSNSSKDESLLSKKVSSLAEIEVDPKLIEPDIKLCEHYQGFSAEIARLSLLLIGGLGWLVQHSFFPGNDKHTNAGLGEYLRQNQCAFLIGVGCLVAAVAASLGHRYFSSDALACQIALLRKRHRRNAIAKSGGTANEEWKKLNTEVQKEKKAFHLRLDISRWLLGLGAACLAVGVGASAWGFFSSLSLLH